MHPKVEKKYREANFERLETPHENTIKLFDEKVKKYRNPVTKEINSIYRIKLGEKEYFFYHQTTRSIDDIGNGIYKFETIGKYDDPRFTYNYDLASGQKIAASILSQKPIYELEWPKHWTPELEKLCTEECNSYVIDGTRKYGGNWSLEEYMKMKFDDIVMLGKFGTLNPVIQNELKKKVVAK